MGLALALLLLPLVAPAIFVLWLIARTDGGPGLYGHERIGRCGVTFKCWKIRTMVCDANERLLELLESDPEARAEWERDQKLQNDPRIIPFGSFMRRTSLDELPQIFNVLRGDMSFVGPRPVVQDELEKYGERKAVYTSIRPGITGLWQVSGRNSLSYSQRVMLDVRYSNDISFLNDIKLISLTPRSVALATGK